MRLSRTLLIAVVAALLGATTATGTAALSVDDAAERAEEAAGRAEVAAGLVDEAVASRAEIELQLAASISRLNELAAELSRVSVILDRLQGQIAFADAEMTGIEANLEAHAVDAYMTALITPGVAFVNSASVERALVAGRLVEDVVNSGRQQIGLLVVKKETLEGLIDEYARQQEEVARLRAEMDAETEHLTELYARADRAVAEAIAEANRADSAYREALDAVASARIKEEERQRQERRPPPPAVTAPVEGSTTTTVSTTTTATVPPSTGGDQGRDFLPAVERWRPLVGQYFPAHRVDEALAIIQCESLGDPDAYNPYSGASGLFQFLPSTWASTSSKAGFPGADVFDPGPNIGSAAWLANRYQELGLYYWQAWSCRRVLS